jgi:hypothetical protein
METGSSGISPEIPGLFCTVKLSREDSIFKEFLGIEPMRPPPMRFLNNKSKC